MITSELVYNNANGGTEGQPPNNLSTRSALVQAENIMNELGSTV